MVSRRIANRGFTIIELLVVLGIMSILSVIVAPRWAEYRTRMVVGEAANVFCQAFREARDEALLEQCEMSLIVDNSKSPRQIEIWRRSNDTDFEPYRYYRFSDEVTIGGQGASLIIGRGGSVSSVSGDDISKKTTSIGNTPIVVYDVVCASTGSGDTKDHVFLTADGRASLGASL